LFDTDEMATDPELEEAAIRFANGDVAGAEGGLLAALREGDLELQAAQSWAAALLDLYRATGNREAFDIAANEFALHLDGVWPVWNAAADDAAKPGPTAQTAPVAPAQPLWVCQPTLTAAGMEALRSALVGSPMPWYLDWSALQAIDMDAMPLLGALFESLCAEHVTLRMDGQEPLLQALRALTPSGEADKANAAWWKVRLDALRALGLQDDFELAALDYCVTFESAPPEWTEAACRMVSAVQGASHTPSDARAADAAEESVLRLSGEILGDATQALSQLDAAPSQARLLVVDCGGLVRVDFAAAGSILNWVSARQGEGKQVQFQNVHRLVAAFFNVIGINEYAKVIPRTV
jgi:ABC-type transporter Mla MlaB component